MFVINPTTLDVTPLQDFYAAHPNVSFPSDPQAVEWEAFGVAPVADDAPDDTAFHGWARGEPYQDGEDWRWAWVRDWRPVETCRAHLHQQVAAHRDALEQEGTRFDFGDEVAAVQTRTGLDTRNIQGVVTTAMILQGQGVTDPVLTFRTADNINRPLTPAKAIELGMAVQTRIGDLYAAKWAHDEAIAALPSAEACAAYDVLQGWPE